MFNHAFYTAIYTGDYNRGYRSDLCLAGPGKLEARGIIREWDKYPEQESDRISLLHGNKYYIEALHIERSGEDHLAAAWETSGLIVEVIPGNCLSPVDLVNPGDVNNDGAADIVDALLVAQFYVGLNSTLTSQRQIPIVTGLLTLSMLCSLHNTMWV